MLNQYHNKFKLKDEFETPTAKYLDLKIFITIYEFKNTRYSLQIYKFSSENSVLT